mgnify:CR=1 FL=1
MQNKHFLYKRYPDLFVYRPSDVIHPHDYFVARYFLRYLPNSVTPNRLTMFRILATPLVFYLILLDHYIAGMISFILVAATDALDGSMARTQNKVTQFGMMFDPVADKLLIGSLVLILVFRFNFWLGFSVLCMEAAILMSALVARFKFKTVRMANLWGKIKMILQVLAVFITLLALIFDQPILITIASGIFGVAVGFALLSLFFHGI